MWKMFNDYGYTEDVISLYICIDMLFNNVPFCYSLFIYLNNSITIHYCFGFIFQINISFFFILPRSRTVNHWIYRLSPLIQKKTLVWHRYNNANNGGVFFKTCRLYYNKLAHGELVRPLSMLKCFNIYRLNYKQSFVCSSIPASLKLSIHLKKKSKHILKHVYFKFIRPMYGIRWIFVTVICLINKLWHALLFIFKDKFLTLFRNAHMPFHSFLC